MAGIAGTREIRQLPPSVVNKIAAGEVIERPASVLKELLENAVDASATRIDVTLEGGGGQLIRVADNGCGMPPEQLPWAVAPHATSKIRTAEDLFAVSTFGFRGEALASVAEVSKLAIRSRTGEGAAGAEIVVDGGESQDVAPTGCGVGTAVEVCDLFFNTPVRRKFLRTTSTELGHCTDAFLRVAMAHEAIHFTLRHGQRTIHDLPATHRWIERVSAAFGPELAEGLLWIATDDDDLKVAGYVADPKHHRANQKMQYLFLNGRCIRDRALSHALSEGYRGLLITGRYPIAFLRITTPPDAVDVNVHPSKLEVRFLDSGRVYGAVLGAIRTRFLATDLTATFGTSRDPSDDERQPQAAPGGEASSDEDARRQELVAWARGALAQRHRALADDVEDAQEAADNIETPRELELRFDDERRAPLSLHRMERLQRAAAPHAAAPGAPPSSPATDPPRRASALQIHNRYLVTETEEGVIIIDQHALHERILYEQLRERALAGAVETQRLLVPEPVRLTASEAAAVLEASETLSRLGILVEPFGDSTVLVAGYPAMLANLSPEEMLRQLIGDIAAESRQLQKRDLFDHLLHSVACKAAIKAGDKLTPEEVDELLRQRQCVQDSHHCPHGRPTSLVFTREELDRRFQRV